MLNLRYPSFASTYLLSCAHLTISTTGVRTPSSMSPFSNFLNSGLIFSLLCTIALYAALVQSRENMRPLFKKFEKGDIEDGVLTPVVEIVRCAQERRYVDANDGYLRLSIGKA